MTASACVSRKLSPRKNRRAALWGVVVALSIAAAAPAFGADAGAQPTPATRAQSIPFKREPNGTSAMLMRVVGGLVVVALLGLAAVYVIKRYFPSLYHPSFAGSNRIKLLEARRLTTRTTLFLIELDGMPLLLAQTSDRITLLYDRPRAGSAADHE